MIHSCSDFTFHDGDALLNFPKRRGKKRNDRGRGLQKQGWFWMVSIIFFSSSMLDCRALLIK